MSELETVLARFKGVRATPAGFVALCPAHRDHSPSLSIASGREGRVLLKCLAGCDTEDVLAAVGLNWRDLFRGVTW
jgi:hypothetical protein